MSYNSIDDLRVVRSAFNIGNYAGCLKELESIPTGTPFADIFRARAQAMLNPAFVDSIPSTASIGLQSIRAFTTFVVHRNNPAVAQRMVDTVRSWVSDPDFKNDVTLRLMTGYILFLNGDNKDALEITCGSDSKNNLEMLALQTQILLAMDRPDLAFATTTTMASVDDDDALYQLAHTWVQIALRSPASLATATTNAQELVEKYGQTVPLLSLLATSLLLQQKYREAFQHLRTARELSRVSGTAVSVDTFINSAVCMFHRGSATPSADEVLGKVIAELKATHPSCEFVAEIKSLEDEFDKCAAQYA